MRRLGLVALAAGMLMITMASEGLCSGDALFVLGTREVDDDWEPTEEHDVFGVTAFFEKEPWPLSLVIGVQASDDDEIIYIESLAADFDIELELSELSVGLAKVWDKHPNARPFIGGGLTFLNAEAKMTEVFTGLGIDDDDSTIAPYAEGGVFWRIGKAFNIGVGARFVFLAEVDIWNVESDVNYMQYHGLVGWGW